MIESMDVVVERYKTPADVEAPRAIAAGTLQIDSPKARNKNLDIVSQKVKGGVGFTRLTIILSDVLSLSLVTLITLAGASWIGLHPAWWVLGLLWLGIIGLFSLAGFYSRLVVHPSTEMREMLRTTAFAVLGVLIGLRGGGVTETDMVVALFGSLAMPLVPFTRALLRVVGPRFKGWGIPVSVVSQNGSGKAIVDGLRLWPEMGLRPVALFENQPEASSYRAPDGLVVSTPQEAAKISTELGVRNAIVSLAHADSSSNGHCYADKLRYYTQMFKQVFVIREATGTSSFWGALPVREGFAGVFLANPHSSSRMYRFTKRLLDICVSLSLGLLLFPVLLMIALAIRIDSRGPVFFKQQRMGRSGRLFNVRKFRTMYPDAEDRLAEILENDPARREEYEAYHKLSDDPRTTRVGTFLRRYSLDELPQLWNVLSGHMSLVGPRAYVPGEISDMDGLERVVLQVRPGVTGLWQVSGRNELSFRSRVDLDRDYVQHATLWLDLFIIVRTIPVVLTAQGAA